MDSPGTLDTAKQEASELKHTTTEQAKNVVDTAKDEASSVLGEAKWQAKDLFAQTQRELKDQAQTQQQRIAVGLRGVSGELDSMATNSPSSGLATDLVRQVSGRLSTASTWLGDRDPAAVMQEVKRFARRRPGTFILAAVVVGAAAGRLTRALASNASDDSSAATRTPLGRTEPDAWAPPTAVGSPAAGGALDTPIYAQSSSDWTEAQGTEDGDVRRDTL